MLKRNENKKLSQVAAFPDIMGEPRWQQLTGRQTPLYDREDDIRTPFARDYTRILHSQAYRRLKHKTQVFFNGAGNDHICTRMEHVAHVESVANSIARALGLNEDLTGAIALAHDLGHAPFGHEGEVILRRLTKEYLGENFWHEYNGLYFVENIELLADNENVMQNLNLTYAVRDGIAAHCGEVDQNGIHPREQLFDLSEFKKAGGPSQFQAATWEGCVVKISDKIAYLGRDIEDAITLGYLKGEQLDALREMAKVRDEKAINTTVIMHNMIIDLVENSSVSAGLTMSREIFEQMNTIKKFNYENIYHNPRLEPFRRYARMVLEEIFSALVNGADYEFVHEFEQWLEGYQIGKASGAFGNKKVYGSAEYLRACIDYIAGMTDSYAERCFRQMLEC